MTDAVIYGKNRTCVRDKRKKQRTVFTVLCIGGGGWIRTIEVEDNRFTVCPLWPLGNSSVLNWSWWTDSNPRPADYKSAALPTELHQRLNARILYHNRTVLSTVFLNFYFLYRNGILMNSKLFALILKQNFKSGIVAV